MSQSTLFFFTNGQGGPDIALLAGGIVHARTILKLVPTIYWQDFTAGENMEDWHLTTSHPINHISDLHGEVCLREIYAVNFVQVPS